MEQQQGTATYRIVGSNGIRERVCATGLTKEAAEAQCEAMRWSPISWGFKTWIENEQKVQRPGY